MTITPEDFLEQKVCDEKVSEDDAYEAVDMAKRQIAQAIIDKYNKNASITVSEILHFCYGIVEF